MNYAHNMGVIKPRTKLLPGLIALLFMVSLFAGLISTASAESYYEVVNGDTASFENDPQGWLFNRDTANATPINFTADESVLGYGSLYVEPLSSEASKKFIGEYFALTDMGDIESFSYDFMVGDGGDPVADANEFYLNVYANFAESDPLKYYDCKYDVVPDTSNGWTNVSFDPENSSYTLTQRNTSPETCPAAPADMGDDAVLRMFAINMGDTSANDAGLDGYFDNAVFTTTTDEYTYDFEPVSELMYSANGGGLVLDESDSKRKDWAKISLGMGVDVYNTHMDGDLSVRFHNVDSSHYNSTTFSADSFTDFNYFNGTSCDAAMNLTAEGSLNGVPGYTLILRAGDNEDTLRFTITNGSQTYDSYAQWGSESDCVGTARAELDKGNIKINQY